MLVPRQGRPEVLAALGEEWRARGAVRVAPLLLEARAVAYLRALRSAEHAAMQAIDERQGFQVWRFGWEPGTGCDHPLCELGRWLAGDGRAWASALTGLALGPPPPMLVSDKAAKAYFVDAWEDAHEGRPVAFRAHFSAASWPAEWGGHLERLDADGALIDRWAPAWNALDLFDLRRGARFRTPLLDRHVEGFTVWGWFA